MALNVKQIPSRIDDPVQILFWEWDEFMLFIATFGAGIVLNYTLSGLIAAVLVTRYFRRSKGNTLPGRLKHLFFWYGLSDLNKRFRKCGEKVYFK